MKKNAQVKMRAREGLATEAAVDRERKPKRSTEAGRSPIKPSAAVRSAPAPSKSPIRTQMSLYTCKNHLLRASKHHADSD